MHGRGGHVVDHKSSIYKNKGPVGVPESQETVLDEANGEQQLISNRERPVKMENEVEETVLIWIM